MKLRRQARILALQSLYEIDVVGHDPNRVLHERHEAKPLPEEGESFARRLVTGVLQYRGQLDAIISRVAPEWPLDQVSPVDRNIMRLAVYEMIVEQDTPYKVVINEAVELAKSFGSDSSSRFINGALGTIAEEREKLVRELVPELAS